MVSSFQDVDHTRHVPGVVAFWLPKRTCTCVMPLATRWDLLVSHFVFEGSNLRFLANSLVHKVKRTLQVMCYPQKTDSSPWLSCL